MTTAKVSVDDEIAVVIVSPLGMAVAAMLQEAAKETAFVAETVPMEVGALIPVAILIVQAVVPVAAPPTVKTRAAVDRPELERAAVMVVEEAQPVCAAVGADEPRTLGILRVMVSAWAIVSDDVKT